MALEVSFRNIRPRDEIKKRGEVLYGKLERFLDPDAQSDLTVAIEHGQAILELVVVTRGDTLKAEESHEELRTALDKLFHTMEMQLRRRKERREDRKRRGGERPDGFVAPDDDEDDDFEEASP
jgi:putative sigma-54 modulation protein